MVSRAVGSRPEKCRCNVKCNPSRRDCRLSCQTENAFKDMLLRALIISLFMFTFLTSIDVENAAGCLREKDPAVLGEDTNGSSLLARDALCQVFYPGVTIKAL